MDTAARTDDRGPLRIDAQAVADADRVIAPGSILISAKGVVEAVGTPAELGRTPDRRVIGEPRAVVIPGLVNAHAHLDLTALGPRSDALHDGFAAWAAMVRRDRPTTAEAVRHSVRLGIEASWRGGTAIVGDIAGSRGLDAMEAMRAAGVRGVSFVEVFGIGAAEDAGLEFARTVAALARPGEPTRVGISPHASYSCGDRLYRAAAGLGLPLATHLSETLDELRFVQDGSGPLADLLRHVGAWRPDLTGWRCSPIERVVELVRPSGGAIAHGNYLSDADVELLVRAAAGACGPAVGIAYCPRASAYFGHPAEGHAAHRYLELLRRGVPVALGTDSMLCLDTPDRLSVLDEARVLHRRDGADARLLLAMATVHGATLLGEPRGAVTLGTGSRPAGILAVDLPDWPIAGPDGLLDAVMAADTSARWVVGPRWSLALSVSGGRGTLRPC